MKPLPLAIAAVASIIFYYSNFDQLRTFVMQLTDAGLHWSTPAMGRVAIASPVRGYLTCFEGVRNSVISEAPIASILQGNSFAGIAMTKDGVATGGDCFQLQQRHRLDNTPIADRVTLARR